MHVARAAGFAERSSRCSGMVAHKMVVSSPTLGCPLVLVEPTLCSRTRSIRQKQRSCGLPCTRVDMVPEQVLCLCVRVLYETMESLGNSEFSGRLRRWTNFVLSNLLNNGTLEFRLLFATRSLVGRVSRPSMSSDTKRACPLSSASLVRATSSVSHPQYLYVSMFGPHYTLTRFTWASRL